MSLSGATATYVTFTGAHFAWSDDELSPGTLVVMNGDNRRTDGDPIYGINVSRIENDPLVMGTYYDMGEAPEDAGVGNESVASVGNSDMWIIDDGADIKAGDYLISSSTPGHATKDVGKYDFSYIIARATEDVDWSGVTDRAPNGKKHKKISVFFENFVKDNTGSRLAAAVAGLEAEVDGLSGGLERLRLDVTGRIELVDARVGELEKANDELESKTEELEARVKQLEWQMLSR